MLIYSEKDTFIGSLETQLIPSKQKIGNRVDSTKTKKEAPKAKMYLITARSVAILRCCIV